ncbi:hypothetical protein [Streptomyces sp. NPDC008150]|uniref:hypothetical protein n=1 Tax=Streptomyces sp. NPDC008150 TaxID=3364816 RepID=UPI0036ED071B
MTAALFIDTLDAGSALCNAFGWWLVLGPAALAIVLELGAIVAVLLLRLAWRAARRALRAVSVAVSRPHSPTRDSHATDTTPEPADGRTTPRDWKAAA